MIPAAENLWKGMERSQSFIEIFTHGLDGDDWTARMEGIPNTALWILGHLALTRGYFLGLLSESFSADEAWGPAFKMDEWGPMLGMGVEPKDSDALPDPETCFDILQKGMDSIHAYLETATLEDLDAPPCHPTDPYLKSKAQIVVHMAHHESHHTGALSMIRRRLGKDRMF